MPHRTVILATAIILSLASGEVPAEGLRSYRHPDLDLQFRAPHGWQHRPRPGDPATHELVDPDTGIHVLMWFTTTEQSARRYLKKMSGMMPLSRITEPVGRSVGGRDAWVLEASGEVEARPVETLLAVIPSGRSAIRPRENNLYIVQITCPAELHPKLATEMVELLESVRITD
jgi:hypothetical protein